MRKFNLYILTYILIIQTTMASTAWDRLTTTDGRDHLIGQVMGYLDTDTVA